MNRISCGNRRAAALAAAGLLFGLVGSLCLALQKPTSAAETKTKPGFATKAELTMNAQDRDFVAKAALDGETEVKLARLATQRAASEGVKQFAQRMIQDHGKANAELKALAREKGFALPQRMTAEQQAMVTQLTRLSGAAFDQAYIKQMVADHERAVALFEKEANEGSNPDLKAWAARTLPTLREHLQMVRSLASASQTPAQPR
jgi:putative membrane protein